MAFSGYLVSIGQLSLVPTIASAALGSICGISFSYWIGRRAYNLVSRYGQKVGVTPESLEQTGRWLDHRGKWGLVIGYFIPGVRHLTAFVAGAARLDYPVFAAFAYAGGFLWSTAFVTAGFFFEREWLGASATMRRMALVVCIAIVFVLLLRYLDSRKKSANT